MKDAIRKVIFCDLDETLVRTIEQLQLYVWNRWKVWLWKIYFN